MRWLFVFSILAFGALGINAGCQEIPDFSATPYIEISDMKLYNSLANRQKSDSIVLDIYYRDGDGDLGLDSTEIVGPFAKYLTNPATGKVDYSRINPNYFNIYVSVFFWNEGKFDSIPPLYNNQALQDTMQSQPYSGRFPRLTTRKEPIEGNLRYVLKGYFYQRFPGPSFIPTIKPGDKYYLVVQISDRERHYSNRVQSDILTAP